MNEKIFITGASSGIGEALAIEYAKQGAILGLSARRTEKLNEVAKKCEELGAKEVLVYTLDVTDENESTKIINQFLEHAQSIDIVIANAGVAYSDKISSGDPTQINKVISTNVIGVTNSIIPFIPKMKEAQSGKIVIISSIASFRPIAFHAGYSSSKAAVRMIADSWRMALKKYNIQLTSICPSFIVSEMTDDNKFPMPFLLQTNAAAKKMVKAIEKGKKTYILPWQVRMIIYLTRWLPTPLYYKIFF
tara:strand:+ start:3058 stop:3801 length:744 start_codon:yes stop_codon:yes gene_type:complete